MTAQRSCRAGSWPASPIGSQLAPPFSGWVLVVAAYATCALGPRAKEPSASSTPPLTACCDNPVGRSGLRGGGRGAVCPVQAIFGLDTRHHVSFRDEVHRYAADLWKGDVTAAIRRQRAMTTWRRSWRSFGIVPVAVIERPEDARPVAQALKAGGLPGLEVTFRTAAAAKALACLAEDHDLLLGAGTVLRTSQVDEAVDAGARFRERHAGRPRTTGRSCRYDLNYRASLWDAYGGQARAQTVNATLAPYVDVMFGNEQDFTQALGFDVPEPPSHKGPAHPLIPRRSSMISDVIERYPNLSVVATTLRTVRSAGTNDWGRSPGPTDDSTTRPYVPDSDILDRVGGGDSFAAGLAYGLPPGNHQTPPSSTAQPTARWR